MNDWTKLRSLAMAATPGPWTVSYEPDDIRLDGKPRVDGIYAPDRVEDYGMGPETVSVRIVETDNGVYDPKWDNAAFIAAANPSAVLALLDELDEARAEVAELRSRLAGAEAANAADTERLTEHSELSGHIDTVEQCRDWIEHEHIMEGGDTSGRLRDFVESLRIVVDQLDKQRRSRNWYESAYSAGKQKLIEHALSKVCCSGEPHTCDQEAIAAAESKTDRLILELTRLRPVYEAAVAWRAAIETACAMDIPGEFSRMRAPHTGLINAIDAAKGQG